MTEVLLALGILFTIGHVAMDLRSFREHAKHPRDWFSAMGAVFLVGHVVLTGELAEWIEMI